MNISYYNPKNNSLSLEPHHSFIEYTALSCLNFQLINVFLNAAIIKSHL